LGIGPVCRGRDSKQGELFVFEAKFEVIENTTDYIYIKDVGGNYRSVTNDAEKVIQKLSADYDLGNRRVFYMDTEGLIDELLHKGPRFTGFKQGHEGVEL
jgi:hypothetical protein